MRKLSLLEGHGTVSKKIALVSELLTSAKPKEAKFVCRTVVDQIRIGVAAGTLRDGIAWAYFPRIIGINDFGKHKKILKVTTKIKLINSSLNVKHCRNSCIKKSLKVTS